MSIIQDLYNIFDKEYSKHILRKSTKNLLVIELSQNLAVLREGLVANQSSSRIIASLEDIQYKKFNENGMNFNSIQKKTLSKNTYGEVKEFNKYENWSTEKLIKKVYERIVILKKFNVNTENTNIHSRLQYLFKYLMVLMAHIEEKHLTIKPREVTKKAERGS